MNSFDIVAIIAVLIVAVTGYFRGLFYQVATLVALAASMLISIYPSEPLSRFAANNEILNEIHTYYLVRIVCAAVIYFILAILIWYGDHRLAKAGIKDKPLNRVGGFFFGLLKGLLGVGGILLALSFIDQKTVDKHAPSLNRAMSMRWCRDHNPFPHDTIVANLQMAFKILGDPQGDEWLATFLKERGLKVEKYMKDLKNHHVMPLIRDNAFRRFLSEKDVFQKFRSK